MALAFIALCQDVGFTIAEIATLLDGRANARQHWQHLAERKLEDIQLQMKKLRDMRRHLQSALACECGTGKPASSSTQLPTGGGSRFTPARAAS